MNWLRMILRAMTALFFLAGMIGIGIIGFPSHSLASDFVVYSVYRPVDLGLANEIPQKDFYVSIGTAQGVGPGTVLEVSRRIATYDLMSEKLYKDMTFPFARLKVIHAESNAAIARLEKFLPGDKTPGLSPTAVMVGDLVRPAP